MTYSKAGRPSVWGKPCKKKKPSKLMSAVFSEWVCPICGANMSATKGREICLNACHLNNEARARFAKAIKVAS